MYATVNSTGHVACSLSFIFVEASDTLPKISLLSQYSEPWFHVIISFTFCFKSSFMCLYLIVWLVWVV